MEKTATETSPSEFADISQTEKGQGSDHEEPEELNFGNDHRPRAYLRIILTHLIGALLSRVITSRIHHAYPDCAYCQYLMPFWRPDQVPQFPALLVYGVIIVTIDRQLIEPVLKRWGWYER